MSQLSSTTVSTLCGVSLTLDATGSGAILRAVFKENDWSKFRRTAYPTIGGAEFQEIDIGGSSNAANWPVTIEIPSCPAIVYAGLRTACDTAATLWSATLHLKATDAGGSEITRTFTSLAWFDLTYNAERGIVAGYYFDVVAALINR